MPLRAGLLCGLSSLDANKSVEFILRTVREVDPKVKTIFRRP